mgnify:CR=1 FL=1
MEKSPEAFRTISEAAEELGLPQHVLRFWETRFATIKPLKRGGGRRYYRPEDVLLLKGIRHLLYDQGFTIKGVQRILKDQGARYVAAIGEGGVVDASIRPAPEDDGDDAVQAPPGARHTALPPVARPPLPPMSGNGRILDAADRDALAGVLRELLDCKRMLERARE